MQSSKLNLCKGYGNLSMKGMRMGYHFCQQMVYDKDKMFDPLGETPRINFSLGPLVSPRGSTVSRCFAIPGHLLYGRLVSIG